MKKLAAILGVVVLVLVAIGVFVEPDKPAGAAPGVSGANPTPGGSCLDPLVIKMADLSESKIKSLREDDVEAAQKLAKLDQERSEEFMDIAKEYEVESTLGNTVRATRVFQEARTALTKKYEKAVSKIERPAWLLHEAIQRTLKAMSGPPEKLSQEEQNTFFKATGNLAKIWGGDLAAIQDSLDYEPRARAAYLKKQADDESERKAQEVRRKTEEEQKQKEQAERLAARQRQLDKEADERRQAEQAAQAKQAAQEAEKQRKAGVRIGVIVDPFIKGGLKGFIVKQVVNGSGAEAAGVQEGDLLVGGNGGYYTEATFEELEMRLNGMKGISNSHLDFLKGPDFKKQVTVMFNP